MMFISSLTMLASTNPLEHLVSRPIRIGPYEISFLTNHALAMILAAILLCVIMVKAAKQRSMVPSGLRNLIEMICCFIRDNVARPILREHTDKYIHYLWTTFFFILMLNLIGMVPTDSILYLLSWGHLHHMGGTATGNIWVTGALAVVAFFIIHISGIREQGVLLYFKNFIPHVHWAMMPLMYVLELIGSLIKPFSLAVRLFANMLAGHAVLGAFVGLIFMSHSYVVSGITISVCAVLSILELFVAFLQAYIFTFLTTLFIASAIAPDH